MNNASFTIECRKFLTNVATFDESPAGQALIDADPRMVLRMLMDEAKKLKSAAKI